MPYVDPDIREYLDRGFPPRSVGELTYVLSRAVERFLDTYAEDGEQIRYEQLAAVVAALEGTKAEFQRQVVAPYEDRKILATGLVFKPR